MCSFQNIHLPNIKQPVSFQVHNNRCTVIFSLFEKDLTMLLRKSCDSENLAADEYSITKGYFFKEGILLANLSLYENIILPVKYHFQSSSWKEYEEKIHKWLDFFQLKVDLNLRPSEIDFGQQKLISYIRTLILEPSIYIISSPFYQLNFRYKKKIIDCIKFLKEKRYSVLIGTEDPETVELFADYLYILRETEMTGPIENRQIMKQLITSEMQEYLD